MNLEGVLLRYDSVLEEIQNYMNRWSRKVGMRTSLNTEGGSKSRKQNGCRVAVAAVMSGCCECLCIDSKIALRDISYCVAAKLSVL